MTEPEVPAVKPTTLSFRITVPLARREALTLRDQMLSAIAPLGLRIAQIQEETSVSLMLNRSEVAARAASETACGDLPT